jgi:hypothetical protein
VRYVCPKCARNDGFYQEITAEVEGTQPLDECLEPNGPTELDGPEHVIDSGEYGCECGWSGGRHEFVQVGIDDKPLPYIHDGQLRLEAA